MGSLCPEKRPLGPHLVQGQEGLIHLEKKTGDLEGGGEGESVAKTKLPEASRASGPSPRLEAPIRRQLLFRSPPSWGRKRALLGAEDLCKARKITS